VLNDFSSSRLYWLLNRLAVLPLLLPLLTVDTALAASLKLKAKAGQAANDNVPSKARRRGIFIG
jgi:hypothetical protein